MKANADEDERSLIEAAQADPARFVDLYERHFHRVYAYASRRASSRAEAEDVTSEVFEHALTNLRKFEWRGVPFLAWLFRIAANALTDRWRRASRDSYELPPDVPDGREAEEIERRAMVFQLVERLPDAQRRVIEMRFVDGPCASLGVQMKKPPPLMLAPAGAPGPNVTLTFCAGMSGSFGEAPKPMKVPSLTVRSFRRGNSGGRLISCTVTENPRESIWLGVPLSVTTTLMK